MARSSAIRPQPAAFQQAFKSSWIVPRASAGALRHLHDRLAAADRAFNLVYSSERDLDVVPQHATKGGALRWLCARLGVPLESVVVAGDTGNDSSMFQLPGVRGIIVGNALPELHAATKDAAVFASAQAEADGVLDGLSQYGWPGDGPVPARSSNRPVAGC